MGMNDSKSLNFAENQVIEWQGRQIHIEKLLGVGLFTDVYRARISNQRVAVKVLRPQSGERAFTYFVSEMRNLRLLWDQWAVLYPDNPHRVTPEYYSGDQGTKPPFFLLELIDGQLLEDLLPIGQELPEQEALELMCQFGQLLTVLHEKLNQCYADIKFGNLWRLALFPGQRPLLKVTDWNVLSERTEAGVTRDLFFASLYLFRLATGIVLPYARGQVKRDPVRVEEFSRLTHGLKSFIRRALHPNLERRYATAQEWTIALAELVSGWAMPERELTMELADAVEQAIELRARRTPRQPGYSSGLRR
jgi:hypothetical protein